MESNTCKIKVAMICHFSNSKVRSHLPLDSRRLYAFTRKVLGLPSKGRGYGDVAAWDTYMITLLQKRDDIELYVISAHSGLKKSVSSFEMEGVHYSFVSCDMATLLKQLIPSPSLWHRLNPMRPQVRRIVSQIKPDIIALIGAENAYYSGTVLGIKGIPLIVKCQTIYNNPNRGTVGVVDKKNAYVEKEIFKDLYYVSVDTSMHERLFRQMNQNAINFKWQLGTLYPKVDNVNKEYDFVNFAFSMIPGKGYTDIVNAMVVVCKSFPNAKLNLVGCGTPDYVEELKAIIKSNGIEKNVVFTPSFAQQEDVFRHIKKSRFAVLPCKLDYIASTIRQAMHYNLPVLCYQTEGTIKINQSKQCVLLAENGNANDLAEKMLMLLQNKGLVEELLVNGAEFAANDNNDAAISQQMSDVFHAVVEHYRNGSPIPKYLMANPNADEKKN